MVKVVFALVCVVGSVGCGCADVALNRVAPAELTLAVGQSATLVYSTGGGCRSGNRTTDIELHEAPTVWHSRDTLVVTVDSLTGRVTGRSAGTAQVYAGGGNAATVHVQ